MYPLKLVSIGKFTSFDVSVLEMSPLMSVVDFQCICHTALHYTYSGKEFGDVYTM